MGKDAASGIPAVGAIVQFRAEDKPDYPPARFRPIRFRFATTLDSRPYDANTALPAKARIFGPNAGRLPIRPREAHSH